MNIHTQPHTPREILERITQVDVPYVNFEGDECAGSIEVHRDVEHDVRAFFDAAVRLEFPMSGVVSASEFGFDDDALMAANMTSGFNYRKIAGQKRLSQHALGRAIDVNPRLNPYTKYTHGNAVLRLPPNGSYDIAQPGTLHASHPLVRFMRENSWEWGGDWLPESGRVDVHHFEKCE